MLVLSVKIYLEKIRKKFRGPCPLGLP